MGGDKYQVCAHLTLHRPTRYYTCHHRILPRDGRKKRNKGRNKGREGKGKGGETGG